MSLPPCVNLQSTINVTASFKPCLVHHTCMWFMPLQFQSSSPVFPSRRHRIDKYIAIDVDEDQQSTSSEEVNHLGGLKALFFIPKAI